MIDQQQIASLNAAFENESPQTMLRWAGETFGRRLTLGTGLGPSGVVLMHVLSESVPGADVFFLDTGLHFEETYELRRALEARLGLCVRSLRPAQTVQGQAMRHGPALWQRDPDLCCTLRKVEPLRRHLTGFELWMTGLRRDQSTTRATAPILSYVARYGILKLNPLANWTEAMVWTYIRAHDLPYNALHDRGYPSIGCAPCTRAVQSGADLRAGRWAGLAKTECGLHLAA
ncbi:MAG: phosphoadenylyl-sulfate reductase [Ardenticatenaceae bacterium]|nr:phosphoadenylyl-sulfate reductase [Ardenticatenaceae bacterium]